MSGFFDDASWVLIPEGIKEDVVYAQKPTNGLGDLAFTRASDATRTNSAGVIERTPWNLFQDSEMFSTANWAKINSSVSANTTTAPNGTLTADTLVENTANSIHIAIQTPAGQISGNTYTASIYAKAAGRSWIGLLNNAGGTGNAFFDLSNGTVGTVLTGSAQIQSVGNGWYRCSITFVPTLTGNFNIQVRIASADNVPTYTGNGTSGIFIWGAQIVEGTDPKPYFATTNRLDVPRLDYRNADGSLNSCPRLLLEPQRTNSIRNSTMVGAVAGSPGTAPTNWAIANAGLTQTVVGIGTESGLQYIDLRFNGNAVTPIVRLNAEVTTQIAATNGQTWSSSCYMKRISGTYDSSTLGFNMRTSGGAGLGAITTATSLTTSLARFVLTGTTNQATTAFVQPQIDFLVTPGFAYDFTIRIAAPQMELGAYATTFIPTTTAAVTRIADVASKTSATALIGQTEGTLFAEVNLRNVIATTRGILEIRTSGTQTIALLCFSNGDLGGYIINSTDQFVRSITTVAGTYKLALAYSASSTALYINGVLVGSQSTSVNIPAPNAIQLGNYGGAVNQLNDSITQAAIFKTRLTNAQLAAITTL
jgi:hypothetical protein